MRRRTRRITLFTAPLIVIALLSGCAGRSGDVEAATGRDLQNRVVAVAEAAAAGDTTGALSALDALEAQLAEAEASGSVSATRAESIRAAIAVVRSDLQPAVETPAPSAEPTTVEPAATEEPADDGSGDDGEQADVDTPGDNGKPGDQGKPGDNGDNGKGDNGNGNGKKDR